MSESNYTRLMTEKISWRNKYRAELAWAEQHLPDEHGPFVALAIVNIQREGGKATKRTVLERLRLTGRDAATIRKAA